MTRILRNALLTEIGMNFIGAAGFILLPRWCLSLVLLPAATPPSPLSISLFQWLGALTLTLNVPLAHALIEGSPQARRQAYLTLGAGEVSLLAVMVAQRAANAAIFNSTAVTGTVFALGSALGWRAYCLLMRPDWINNRDKQH